jgi:hypothetical protein
MLIEGLGARIAEALAGLIILMWLLLVGKQVIAADP